MSKFITLISIALFFPALSFAGNGSGGSTLTSNVQAVKFVDQDNSGVVYFDAVTLEGIGSIKHLLLSWRTYSAFKMGS